MDTMDSLGLGEDDEVRVGSLVAEVREISMGDRMDDGMASDECLKLWMEAEANCDAAREHRFDAVNVDNRLPLAEDLGLVESMMHPQSPITWEKEEWSPDAVIVLLEAYEERLGEVNNGNLKAKDWEEVAALVNRHCDGSRSLVGVKQCKRKVYALRRWYRTIRTRQAPYRPIGYEVNVLMVLDRIMTPYPYQAGIPGGIDAGERLSFPTPSSFDEEEELPGTDEGLTFPDCGTTQLGKRSRNSTDENIPVAAVVPLPPKANAGTAGVNGVKKKVARKGYFGPSREVANALKGFAKVLSQIEIALESPQRNRGLFNFYERVSGLLRTRRPMVDFSAGEGTLT
ncbi:hypothetical protein R1sor_013015 [Riccia sorocarpa]|uniref:Myb/SANT-like DNA-binding domain-containing protein n=1 Tax=Riccia sorocarpa TaxID=122646 RepID=A0ABD3H767_9MARC